MTRQVEPTKKATTIRNLRIAALGLLALVLLLSAGLLWSKRKPRSAVPLAIQPAETTQVSSDGVEASSTPVSIPETLLPLPAAETLPQRVEAGHLLANSDQGTVLLSIVEAGNAHLFAYTPGDGRLLRLTMGDWDDISPSISPDGRRAAFSSNRSGYWDLYLVSLEDGSIQKITESNEYEGSPSWSPDGLWLAYEAYVPDEKGGNLEILIRPVDGSQPSIRLTDYPGADFSPAWSPGGRVIAFVSDRTGELEIWSANLDRSGDRFENLSQDVSKDEHHPAWSPDGSRLAWTATSENGVEQLYLWDPANPADVARALGSGGWPAWSPTGDQLMSVYRTPNQSFLTGYRIEDGQASIPLLETTGDVLGISWTGISPGDGFENIFKDTPAIELPPLWLSRQQVMDEVGRVAIVPLPGVQAPLAMLQDQVDESFNALRQRVADESGWDYLTILEEAYVPLTSPLEPGSLNDWLYTGRAIKTNGAPAQAGWLVLVQESYGPETYWRIYLRARDQDGSQGIPLQVLPFDLNARHSGDPRAYEAGGARDNKVPAEYWVDFTRLAQTYGWERLPALSTWRTAYSGVRYNEYVLRDGVDWFSAMLQIYPRVALNTPTRVLSPTPTLTPTKTATPAPTLTATRRPTATVTATSTRRPTLTPVAKP